MPYIEQAAIGTIIAFNGKGEVCKDQEVDERIVALWLRRNTMLNMLLSMTMSFGTAGTDGRIQT